MSPASAVMPPLALLVGGTATRLRPITETIPKAMIQVAGEPFISHQLRLLKREGLSKVVICLGYRGEQIKEFVQDGTHFGLKVFYSFDGPKLLGTGGAVKKALPLLGEVFFVLYGDSYLDCDYCAVKEAFQEGGKPGLMTVFRNEGKWDKSNIFYRAGKILRYDKKNVTPKMKYIDYGLSILNKKVFRTANFGDKFDLADLYKDLIDSGQMVGYDVKERFYEIGSVKGLKETQAYIKKKG